MLKFLAAILFAMLLASVDLLAQQSPAQYSRVKIWLDGTHTVQQLSRLGVAADHGDYRKGVWLITDLSAAELETTRGAGFPTDVLIPDVSAFYAKGNAGQVAQKPADMQCVQSFQSSSSVPVVTPSHFHLGNYGGRFFGYSELLQILDSMQQLYPNLISLRQPVGTFQTYEGRPVYWLRISNNPGVDQPAKPQMLYTAVHHAREPGGLNVLVYYLWYLLENYGVNDKVTAIVDNTELYFMPCLNPDGYIYNQTTNPDGGGMWRKNRRPNGDGTTGVDLNRNYGYEWGYDDIGSSPFGDDEVFRGASAFSEAETQAVQWFANQHQFKIALNYHSYSNLLIYPWGYQPSFLTPDSVRYKRYGEYLTNVNRYTDGTCNEVLNYLTNGGSDDWMYGEQTSKPKILSMTPEVGMSGFYPAAPEAMEECSKNLSANVDAAGLLLPFARVWSLAPPSISTITAWLPYRITSAGLADGIFKVASSSLTPNLTTPADTHYYASLAQLQSAEDSFAVSIDAATPAGTSVGYVLHTVQDSRYASHDTFYVVFGDYPVVAEPSTDNLTDWVTFGSWDVDNQYAYSGTTCLSESPQINYQPFSYAALELAEPVDLTSAVNAYLEYYARWDVEDEHDYVMVEAQDIQTPDTWYVLCGLYTTPGGPNQWVGAALYDGLQTTWVKERVPLTDFLGKQVKVRFRFVSDEFGSNEGFFLDDVKIKAATGSGLSANNGSGKNAGLLVYPNPATDMLQVQLPQAVAGQSLNLTDATGRTILTVMAKPGASISIPVDKLARGVYFLKSAGGGAVLSPVKVLLR